MKTLTIELVKGQKQEFTFLGWKDDGLAFYATDPKKGQPAMIVPVSAYPDDTYCGELYRFPKMNPLEIIPKRFNIAWSSQHREVLRRWREAKLAEVNAEAQETLFSFDALRNPRPPRTPAEINRRRHECRESVESHFNVLMETPLDELLDPIMYAGALDEFQIGRWADEMGEDFRAMLREATEFSDLWHSAYDSSNEHTNYQLMLSDLCNVRFVMRGEDGCDYHLSEVHLRPPSDTGAQAYVLMKQLVGEDTLSRQIDDAANRAAVTLTTSSEKLTKAGQQVRADAEAGASALGARTKDLAAERQRLEAVPGKLAVESQRIEAATDQLTAKTKALDEVISPLNRLYSDVELAEIRKRANGEAVPDLFADWALMQFQRSSPEKLPSKGDAFNHCGPGTVIGKKLEQAGYGICKQTFAGHLTVLRRLLEKKGWLARRTPGKSRKRNSRFRPDDRLEDINQPSPAESAEDRDDERQASGLDIGDKESEEAGGDSSKQSDAD